jgi:hypothetical protein
MAMSEKTGSRTIAPRAFACVVVVATSLLIAGPGEALAQGWPGYAHDPQHTCTAVGASLLPQQVRWKTSVDLSLINNSGSIYIHYGTPVITRLNTVLVPVKTTSSGNYRVDAHSAASGTTLWSATSDYALPAHDWVPIFGITLTPKDHSVVYPGAGGTIYARTFPDSAAGATTQYAFYNPTVNGVTTNLYAQDPDAFAAAIQICTPISSDSLGNLYFGYVSSGAALPGYPNGIPSGLARVSSTGVGSFVAATAMSGDPSTLKVAYNCSPAFSADGSTVYVAVNNENQSGYLCGLSTTTLATKYSTFLYDPRSTPGNVLDAIIDDDGSATPTVGPDGDVYYGVLAYNISDNNYRGFLLHFNNTLSTTKIPNAFGWDDTASVVPASAVPSYTGTSAYLLLTKYNNYAGGGGNGQNMIALVDPDASMVDPISGVTVMQTILTVLGVTPDPDFPNTPGAVREWCINSAAIDVINKCAVVNSEDGHVYRWSFVTNQLSAGLYLEPSTSEAYTPTVIGPDGAVYAINNAVLVCCVSN